MDFMKRVILAGALSLASMTAARAGNDIAAPVLGYVGDTSSSTLRMIEGIPGASILGRKLDLGPEIILAAVSPDQTYIWGIAAQGGVPSLLAIGAHGLESRAVEGIASPVDRIAISPSGTAAALYSDADGTLRILTGLPGNPVVAREISAAVLDRMAVSDDGALIVLVSKESPDPALLSSTSSGAVAIPVSGPVSALAFRPQSHDALIATAGRITLVRAVDSEPTYAAFEDSPDPAVAVQFSIDGRRIFAAYADGKIRTRDLATGESFATVCPCLPTGLQPLSNSVFRLNQVEPGPVFLFDGLKNRVLFVAGGDQ
jgi:WD40 repeat protein